MTDLVELLKQMQKENREEINNINGRVLIVDALNSYIRCFAAVPTMNDDGAHVGGISGFLKSVGAAIRTFRPSRCVLVFDGKGGSQRRRKLYPEYKDGRRSMTRLNRTYDFKDKTEEEEAMKWQLIALAHMLRCLPVTVLSPANVEADDVIAYIATLISEKRNGKAIIMSTDKDFLQMVNNLVSVYNPIKKKVYEPQSVLEEYGIHPHNFAIFRAMDGDVSDNIPGVKGVGRKTLSKAFPQLAQPEKLTLDEILVYADAQMKGKLFEKIRASRTILEKNYELMQLAESNMAAATKMDIIHRLDSTVPTLDKMKLNGLIREHQMLDAFGDINRWLLTTFQPLTRFTLESTNG